MSRPHAQRDHSLAIRARSHNEMPPNDHIGQNSVLTWTCFRSQLDIHSTSSASWTCLALFRHLWKLSMFAGAVTAKTGSLANPQIYFRQRGTVKSSFWSGHRAVSIAGLRAQCTDLRLSRLAKGHSRAFKTMKFRLRRFQSRQTRFLTCRAFVLLCLAHCLVTPCQIARHYRAGLSFAEPEQGLGN